MIGKRGMKLVFGVALTIGMLLLGGVSSAAALSPWWHVSSQVRPSNLPPGGEGTISVQAVNAGDGRTSGLITMADTLPAGMEVVEEEVEGEMLPAVQFYTLAIGNQLDLGTTSPFRHFPLPEGQACSTTASTVTCALKPADMEILGSPEIFNNPNLTFLRSFESIEMRVKVKVGTAVSGAQNKVLVTGGGATEAHQNHPVNVDATPTPFGAENLSLIPEEEGGAVDSQAGSHPFQLTTTFALNQTADPLKPPALPRNVAFKLPAGLVGNARIITRCTDQQFQALAEGGTGNACPQSSALGVVSISVDEPLNLRLQTLSLPLFNLTPGIGEPARFGFEFAHAPVTIDTSVRSGTDYGVTASVNNVTELLNFISTTVTFWGVPGDPRHDEARGWGCLRGGFLSSSTPCLPSTETEPPPFLTLPTSCRAPFATSVAGSSWATQADPAGLSFAGGPGGEYSLKDEFERPIGMTGCNRLPYDPSVTVQPDVQSGSTPSGLTVHVRVPQEVNQNPQGISSSNVRNITVELPEGMTLNPAGAGGLESCSSNPGQTPDTAGNQIGFKGSGELDPAGEPGAQTLLFDPVLPEPLSPGLELGAHGFCPNASKVGTVNIVSPLIEKPLVGSVYLARQNENPFGSLVAMYIVAEDPVSGTIVKLPGRLWLCKTAGEVLAGETCGVAGQIVSTFENQPQLPFEDAELHFFGGSRAPLSTPAHCGSYTTSASFVPWAAEPSDLSSATRTASSTFAITSGPNGAPCPGASLPFGPSLTGGMTNINAGSFSPLTTTIGREDGQQDMQSVQLQMPPGLSGILAGVKLCPEAQANEGTCGPESQIGETTVSAGLGNEPVSVTGGRVYITEKYGGAPFGLSIVNPVKTGPFDLERDTANPNQNPACDCVVVRARIEVDASTAALTITTDTSGAHAIPHMIDGIPVQIKHVNVLVNRPGFTFNPTNCNPMSITGSIASAEGGSSPVGVPLQVTNCASLKFAPKFQLSTSGRTSKADGASLTAKLSYPDAPQGTQANIAKVKVELPKQLPSRLTTLQKACTNAQFLSNPAGCPPASIIGHVTVHTPLLPVPLTGPAYFVSHGGEAFPSLTMVLQGYGVMVDLVGTTFINKAGVTSTTFKTVPDVPFNTFELTLPQGKYSALAANGDLCTSKLAMGTEFLAQNGALIRQNTPVSVTGCAKKKALTRAQKLAAALKVCKRKVKGKRAACVRQARRRYGSVKAKTKKKRK